MSYFSEAFKMDVQSKTDKKCVIEKGNIRISVLTPCLVRVENSKNGIFTDEPTQIVWFRNFDFPEFSVDEKGENLKIRTTETVFEINTRTGSMQSITLSNGSVVTNYSAGNLLGTYRTLDMTSGSISLDKGILSKNGVSMVDDSKSLILKKSGEIAPREFIGKDIYYFAYAHEYRRCIADLYRLTGKTPLVPRYCLGNWWSRYKAYTQEEYVELMQHFIDDEIPISVATIDMDWHWVDVKSKFGEDAKRQTKRKNIKEYVWASGWTGYSWNTDLFPDYKGFLKWLQDMNFKVTVNVHPSDGIRCFEDQYEQMAEGMGVDPKTKQEIPFDITDPKFIENYFTKIHHPYEDEGVDFWWIDWQQGKNSNLKGLDPLWALNHYHSLDLKYRNSRPLILSRYAGIGSHRYPLGFSGDTAINWKVLDFQPYFTANASNAGYSWWSHDIGGHHMGKKDDELYTRWVQFGAFSPIMRLHSTSNEFNGKEPWKFRFDANMLCRDALRLRHRMIPYLYTMNYLTYKNGKALCEPMYYSFPEADEAYRVKNEYTFGTELIACPITEKTDRKTNFASCDVWLPKGRYTDIFTGYIYEGEQSFKAFRGVESIPVFAKEGAIIPLEKNDRNNHCENPTDMELWIYRGNNSFSLYEDDGVSMEFERGRSAFTLFAVSESGSDVVFTVSAAEGDKSVLPEKRNYTFSFRDVVFAENVKVIVSGKKVEAKISGKKYICISVDGVLPTDNVEISLSGVKTLENPDKKELAIERISRLQMGTNVKKSTYTKFLDKMDENSIPGSNRYKPLIAEIFRMK